MDFSSLSITRRRISGERYIQLENQSVRTSFTNVVGALPLILVNPCVRRPKCANTRCRFRCASVKICDIHKDNFTLIHSVFPSYSQTSLVELTIRKCHFCNISAHTWDSKFLLSNVRYSSCHVHIYKTAFPKDRKSEKDCNAVIRRKLPVKYLYSRIERYLQNVI